MPFSAGSFPFYYWLSSRLLPASVLYYFVLFCMVLYYSCHSYQTPAYYLYTYFLPTYRHVSSRARAGLTLVRAATRRALVVPTFRALRTDVRDLLVYFFLYIHFGGSVVVGLLLTAT